MQRYVERCQAKDELPRQDYLELFRKQIENDLQNEQDKDWKKENLEYDLRSTEWICRKAAASDAYAQNIYAALCNQEWQKNDVWPLLKGQTWGCSWRYSSGIVAHMRQQGDYMDWYCSGMRGDGDVYATANFVSEGTITDEIREDFFQLGWVAVNNTDNND